MYIMYPYVFLTLSILTNIIGQVMFKLGANHSNIVHGFLSKILNGYILGGLLLYVFGAAFWIMALTKLELSSAYPIISLSYIGIALVSFYVFNEPLGLWKVIGIITIILGIIIMNH